MWKVALIHVPARAVGMLIPPFINPSPAVMTDVRFRRAAMHAMDRQAMADELMKGQSAVAHAFLNPQEPEYAAAESGIVRYDYDPRAAARLIEELGYSMGPDGIYT